MSATAPPQQIPKFRFYQYEPSAEAAITFIVLFGILTLLHSWQMLRTRAWYLIPFVVGGIFSAVGYAGRYLSSQETAPFYSLENFVLQTVLLLVAPALFAASIYMELKRVIMLVHAEHHSPVRMRWLTKIFVTGDVISFFAQAGGGSLFARAKTNPDIVQTAENIVVAGLFVQLIFFALFVVTSVLFHIRTRRNPTPVSTMLHPIWHKHMYCLYFVSLLIFVRSAFRVVEFLQGQSGQLMSHEVYLYIFDATLMFVVMVALNIVHPSELDGLAHGGLVSRMAGFRMERVAPAEPKVVPGDAEMRPIMGSA